MKSFDRQKVLILINHQPKLAEIYLKTEGTIDEKLQYMFTEHIGMDAYFSGQYDGLTPTEPVKIYDDSPVVKRLKTLIDEIGWRQFIEGLSHLAFKKGEIAKALGLAAAEKTWKAVYKKVSSTPKNVQL